MNTTIATGRIRVSKKLLASLPVPIANQIQALQQRYHTIKTLRVSVYAPGYTQYLSEDSRYHYAGFDPKSGQYVVSSGIEMASEHNFQAATATYRHEIGAGIPIPVGGFVFEVYYAGCDGYQLALINVSGSQFNGESVDTLLANTRGVEAKMIAAASN